MQGGVAVRASAPTGRRITARGKRRREAASATPGKAAHHDCSSPERAAENGGPLKENETKCNLLESTGMAVLGAFVKTGINIQDRGQNAAECILGAFTGLVAPKTGGAKHLPDAILASLSALFEESLCFIYRNSLLCILLHKSRPFRGFSASG